MRRGLLGCPHYRRRCAVVAPCCERTYTCRECHDEAEADHDLDSKLVETMLCMECNCRQPAAGMRAAHLRPAPSHAEPEPSRSPEQTWSLAIAPCQTLWRLQVLRLVLRLAPRT